MERIKSFDTFSKRMSRQIDNRKARKDAQEEIYSHLVELTESFVEKGMTEADAQKAAIESMADADFLGIKFDQIHTPKMKWWHYAILVIVLISVVVAAIIYVNWYTQKVHDNNKDVSPDKQISQYYEQHGKENNYETGS